MSRFARSLSEGQRQKLIVDHEDGFLVNDLAQRYGISPRTVQRVLSEDRVRKRTNNQLRKPLPKTKRKLKPCGTNAAYARHIRNREIPCEACCKAHADAQKEWKTGCDSASTSPEPQSSTWLISRAV